MKVLKSILLLVVIMFWTIVVHLSKNLFSEGYLQIGVAVITSVFFIAGLVLLIVLVRLKYFLKKELKPNKSEKAKSYLGKYIGTIFLAMIMAQSLIFGINETINPSKLNINEITSIKGTIKEVPLYTSGAKAGSGSIHFKINEFPEISFSLAFDNYLHYQTSIEDDIKINDSVFFFFFDEDYSGYIKKDGKLSFSQKHTNHNRVTVFTIHSKEQNYMTISKHDELSEDDSKYALPLMTVFFLIGLLAIQFIWKGEIYLYLDKRGMKKTKAFLVKVNEKK